MSIPFLNSIKDISEKNYPDLANLEDVKFMPKEDDRVSFGRYVASDIIRLNRGEFVYLSNFSEALRYLALTDKTNIAVHYY